MTTPLFSCTLMHSYWIHFTFLSAPLRLYVVCNLRSLSRGWLLCQLRMPISISNPLRKRQQPLSWFSKSLPLRVWEKQPLSIYTSFSLSLQHFPSLRDTYRKEIPQLGLCPHLPGAFACCYTALWVWWSCSQQVPAFLLYEMLGYNWATQAMQLSKKQSTNTI